jgi:hypothetical protein
MYTLSRKAKIYVVFSSSGFFGSTGTYKLRYPEGKVLTNEDILKEIKKRCKDVEFIGTTEVEKPGYAEGNIQSQAGNLDGILYFGTLPQEILDIDIPKIAVFPLWSKWQYPYSPVKGKRMLTGCIPIIPDINGSVFSSRFDDVARKIELIRIISSFKSLNILVVTDKPVLGLYEPTPFQYQDEGWALYEKRYIENLHQLGANITARPQSEMVARIDGIEEEKAKEVAEKWMEEAEDVVGTNKEEITKSARLYLVMKEMMKEYGCNAITTEGYGVFINYPGGPIPSQGLPSSQFCTEGVVATSETLFDSLVTQQLGLLMTGFAGMNGDYVIDEGNNKAYVMHCECPFNDPLHKGKNLPFVIRNLPQYPVDQQEKGGASVLVRLPVNKQVTVVKFSVHDKKVSLFSGTTVDGDKLFLGWDHILCRTKAAVDTDAKALLRNLDWKTFGVHRVAFFGDYRQQFKDMAELMGYEVVEKDR